MSLGGGDETARIPNISQWGGGVAANGGARTAKWTRIRTIGVLTGASGEGSEIKDRIAAFLQELQRLGCTEGRNMRIVVRGASGSSVFTRKYASELVSLAPDVILAIGNVTMSPLLEATRTVPIVFTVVIVPVGADFVQILSRPGGNVTGFMMFEYSLSAKWVELLKEIAPSVRRVAVLREPSSTAGIGQFAVIQAAAPSFGIEVGAINVREVTKSSGRSANSRARATAV